MVWRDLAFRDSSVSCSPRKCSSDLLRLDKPQQSIEMNHDGGRAESRITASDTARFRDIRQEV